MAVRIGVGVQLVGGPADDCLIFIPEDPMNPPEIYRLTAFSGGRVVRLIYEREVNRSDDGPLWLYRFTGKEAA